MEKTRQQSPEVICNHEARIAQIIRSEKSHEPSPEVMNLLNPRMPVASLGKIDQKIVARRASTLSMLIEIPYAEIKVNSHTNHQNGIGNVQALRARNDDYEFLPDEDGIPSSSG